ncbi:MAG: hypothetical protein JWN70_3646 [Planctomycetaceae bacterium]|nr:hypothetical protein [Planctomycetaceae bacterium]
MTVNQRSNIRQWPWFLTCLSSILLSGCGLSDSGPTRYDATGAVTFQGKPVPYGEIIFEPDSSKGNEGPAARAVIENGTYKTEKDKGVVAGAVRVRISGYDGNPPPGGGTQPHGKPLFSEYVDKVDQPEDVATHDFSIGKK